MKLLLCPKCYDVFKLTTEELRTCRCGLVKGMYDKDGHHSVSNGKGYSLALDNNYVYFNIGKMEGFREKSVTYDDYYKDCRIPFWVRPNEGTGNPRSRVDENL